DRATTATHSLSLRDALPLYRSAPGLAGTGKTRSRALARLRAMARESLAGAVAARGSPASCRSPRLGAARANGAERRDGSTHAGIRRADACLHEASSVRLVDGALVHRHGGIVDRLRQGPG